MHINHDSLLDKLILFICVFDLGPTKEKIKNRNKKARTKKSDAKNNTKDIKNKRKRKSNLVQTTLNFKRQAVESINVGFNNIVKAYNYYSIRISYMFHASISYFSLFPTNIIVLSQTFYFNNLSMIVIFVVKTR